MGKLGAEDSLQWDPDVSIDEPIKDRLSRAAFAARLGEKLRDRRQKDCLVVGLCGAWGSGKTSIWRLAWEHLRTEPVPIPPVVEFKAWGFSGEEALTAAFFSEMAETVDRYAKAHGLPRFGRTMRQYGRKVADWLGLGSEAAALISDAGVPAVALVWRFLRMLGGWFFGGEDRQSLKQEISKALNVFPQPLIVVIDDIDRLAADEIALLFRLIKQNADFPRVIYLLLFDRDYVAAALDKLAPERGAEFLEKVVQVIIDVPHVDDTQLRSMLVTEFRALLAALPTAELRFDEGELDTLLDGGLLGLLRHPRDVHRLINGLRFVCSAMRLGTLIEVDGADLLGMELLRIRFPKLYTRLAREHDLLTIRGNVRFGGKDGEAVKAKSAADLWELVPDNDKAAVRALLALLFPNSPYSTKHRPDESLVMNRRVGSWAVFPIYFQCAVPPGHVSASQVEEAVSKSEQLEKLRAHLKWHLESGTLLALLRRLDPQTASLPHPENWIRVLLDLGDDLPLLTFDDITFGGIETSVKAFSRDLFKRLGEARPDGEMFLRLLSESKALHYVFEFAVTELAPERAERRTENGPLLPDARLPELERILCEKFVQMAEDRLDRYPYSAAWKLENWKRLAGASAPADWIRRRLASATGTRKLIEIIFSSSDANRVSHKGPGLVRWLVEIIPAQEILTALNSQFEAADEAMFSDEVKQTLRASLQRHIDRTSTDEDSAST
jgi:hypothetical protein